MNKEDLIGIGLTEEQAGQVIEGFKGFIPKARFDEVNEGKKKAEETVAERDGQLETLKSSTGNVEELKGKIEALQTANVEAGEKHKAEIEGLKLISALDKALVEAGAKNIKMVKPLLNMENVKLDGERLIGLEDQIKALKSDPGSMFAFIAEGDPTKEVKGLYEPGKGNSTTTTADNPKSYLDWVDVVEGKKK